LRRLADPALEIGLPPPDRVIDAASSLPWWQGDHVRSPEPDLMAAALLVKILSERGDKAPEWLWAVMKPAVTPQLIDRLGRLAFDAMSVTGSSSDFTQYLKRMIVDEPSRATKLKLICYERELPVALASFAADVTRALLGGVADEAKRTDYLTILSSCLHDAGDGVGALTASREAVEIHRRLAQDNPVRFARDLAVSLGNLSVYLSAAGDRAGALAATREVVDTFRRLAQDDPSRFAPDLAGSLYNLSSYLSAAGDGARCAGGDPRGGGDPSPTGAG
jgi:hypothetical protein